jgi:hypothetical protein
MNISLTFLADSPIYQREKLYEIWQETDADVPKTNCEFVEQPDVVVNNMRIVADQLDFESTGFNYLKAPSSVKLSGADCTSDDNAKVHQYLMETIQLVKSEMSADDVICFDWRVKNCNFARCSDSNGHLRSIAKTQTTIPSESSMPPNLDGATLYPRHMWCI